MARRAQDAPKTLQRSPQDPPKTPQDTSRRNRNRGLKSDWKHNPVRTSILSGFGWFWGRFRKDFGRFRQIFWRFRERIAKDFEEEYPNIRASRSLTETGLCWGGFAVQDASTTPPRRAKTPQDAAKTPQDAPKTPQDATKRLQERPRRPQEASKSAQDAHESDFWLNLG